jgi:folate-dependent phosphoribosylglycinamide formyltransferase PurN
MEEPQHELGTIRVAYVTSPRELASEGVGTDGRIAPTLEFLQRQIAEGNPLLKNVRIAAVVVDDDGRELGRKNLEQATETFNYLRQLCRENGITFQVEKSAEWRGIPKSRPEEKHAKKVEYEQRLLSFMRQNNIDVVFSDSYVVLFNSTMLDAQSGYRGLIINLHPGIASEVPGVYPTRDALARANFFTSSPFERSVLADSLNDQVLAISRDGHDASIRNVLSKIGADYSQDEKHTYVVPQRGMFRATTGATLHVVDELVDHGPVILASTATPVRAGDSEQELRVRNYATKNNVAARGLAKYLASDATQDLISENRIKNRAYNSDMLPTNGSLQIKAKTRAQNAFAAMRV